MIKAVICDLDETLLKSDKTISTQDIETIQKLKAKGIHFIPATGRPFYSIDHTLETLELNDKNRLSVTYNGGMVHENSQKEVLRIKNLTHDVVRELFNVGQSEGISMHIYVEHETYTFNLSDAERIHLSKFPNMNETDKQDIDFLEDTEIIKILFHDLDLDNLRRIEASLPDALKEYLEISYSSNRYIEFNPKGISKGEAIEYVASHLGISTDEILTIGDNINDLTMIQSAGYSGAPSNAVEAVKQAAKYVSKCSYDESAVTDIVNHFIQF